MCILNKTFSMIKKVHPEWEINPRKDGNFSIKAPDSKVFAYFTYEFGVLTINLRLYKTNSDLTRFSGIYNKSVREFKIGKWKDEVIDVKLNDEKKINIYINILELAHSTKNKKILKVQKILDTQIVNSLTLKSVNFSTFVSLN